MGSPAHLVSRFFGSLWPFGPRAATTEWVSAQLTEAEYELWSASSAADRRHSAGVARRTIEILQADGVSDVPTHVVRAALLHDIGKNVSHLGTYTRVAATLSAAVAGRETAELWVKTRGITRRIGQYLQHPDLGADLLAMAGSDQFVVDWARQHHWPADERSVDERFAAALDAADND